MPNSSLRRMLMARKSSAPSGGIVTDGLVFRLNGLNQGGVDGQWIDEIGGEILNLLNCEKIDSGVKFSIAKRSVAKGRVVLPDDKVFVRSGTVQFCYSNNTGKRNEFAIFCAGVWNIGGYINTLIVGSGRAQPRMPRYAFDTAATPEATVSVTDKECIANAKQIKQLEPDHWTQLSSNLYIGSYRASEDGPALDAIVHEIRFYNRHLTESEILQNQQYDVDTYFGGVSPNDVWKIS